LLGARVNLELLHKIYGSTRFDLSQIHFGRTGSSTNLVRNSDFNNGLNDWFVIATTPVTVENDGSDNFLHASCSINQSISLTSSPVFVTPGRSYTVRYDARIFAEARNSGYFFVIWYATKEIQRDRMFLTFPKAVTVISTDTSADGSFRFRWRSNEPGVFTIGTTFPGSTALQPSIRNNRIEIQ